MARLLSHHQGEIFGRNLKINSSCFSSSASLAIETALAEVTTEASTSGSESAAPTKTKPNRCQVCKKRVGLTGFPCRCGGLYCGEHRYDSAHDCQVISNQWVLIFFKPFQFDYKTIEREEIRKNNPVVMSEKIQKI